VKIRPEGAGLYHVDRRTDRRINKLIVTFGNFAKAPEELIFVSWYQCPGHSHARGAVGIYRH